MKGLIFSWKRVLLEDVIIFRAINHRSDKEGVAMNQSLNKRVIVYVINKTFVLIIQETHRAAIDLSTNEKVSMDRETFVTIPSFIAARDAVFAKDQVY